MASNDEPKVLLWDVESRGDDGVTTYGPFDVETWNAEERLAVKGAPGDFGYLYVVQDEESRRITVLLSVEVEAAGIARDATVRIPSNGAWLWMGAAGNLRVIGSMAPLDREAIAKLLGGHNPPPTSTTTDPRAGG